MGITKFDLVQANAFLGPLEALGAGNIYYVCQAANTAPYARMVRRYGGQVYEDGSQILHTTIASALTATVANRNDYVIVMPDSSDYDITATITMDKARTHLIAPSGLGWNGMPPNMVRVHVNTAATDHVTISADAVEVAGFFFKQDATSTTGDIITLSGTRWYPHIHDNFFGMYSVAAGTNVGIDGTVVNHCSIHNNFFCAYSPAAMTGTDNDLPAFIRISSNSSTRGVIRDNIAQTGSNTAVAAGFSIAGSYMMIMDNVLAEDKAVAGVAEAGTLTLGISTTANSHVLRNKIFIVTANNGNAISGAHADDCISNHCGDADGELLVI